MTHHLKLSARCLALTLAIAGCAGTETLVAAESDALLGAQCTYDGFKAAADACFTAFDACANAEGADVEVCKADLKACLPPPPEGKKPWGDKPPPPPGDHVCDGGHPEGPPPIAGADTSKPELGGPEGNRPPPPPGGLNTDGTHPPDGKPGDGPGRPPPLPEKAAIEACRAAFDACLSQTPVDSAACRDAEKACIGAAFEAAFAARCEEAATRCANPDAPADKCAEITARCAEGVHGPPEGAACQ